MVYEEAHQEIMTNLEVLQTRLAAFDKLVDEMSGKTLRQRLKEALQDKDDETKKA